jgi:hypothetical protein
VVCLAAGHHDRPHEKGNRRCMPSELSLCNGADAPDIGRSHGGSGLGPLHSNSRVTYSHNAEAEPLIEPPRRVIYQDAEP